MSSIFSFGSDLSLTISYWDSLDHEIHQQREEVRSIRRRSFRVQLCTFLDLVDVITPAEKEEDHIKHNINLSIIFIYIHLFSFLFLISFKFILYPKGLYSSTKQAIVSYILSSGEEESICVCIILSFFASHWFHFVSSAISYFSLFWKKSSKERNVLEVLS